PTLVILPDFSSDSGKVTPCRSSRRAFTNALPDMGPCSGIRGTWNREERPAGHDPGQDVKQVATEGAPLLPACPRDFLRACRPPSLTTVEREQRARIGIYGASSQRGAASLADLLAEGTLVYGYARPSEHGNAVVEAIREQGGIQVDRPAQNDIGEKSH